MGGEPNNDRFRSCPPSWGARSTAWPSPRWPSGPNYTSGQAVAEGVWIGTFFWIVVHGGIAAALFAIAVATFDRCLGRVSETPGLPVSGEKKKPVAELEPDY